MPRCGGADRQLETLYRQAFEQHAAPRIWAKGPSPGSPSYCWRSREAAITPLQEEIEDPLITAGPE